ncbi:MAG: hypothetical protein ACRDPM_06215 [Solirubrobacteraceae bacterium]
MTKKYTELFVVVLVIVTIALSLTIHAPALALLAAVFGLLAAGMRIGDLLDD